MQSPYSVRAWINGRKGQRPDLILPYPARVRGISKGVLCIAAAAFLFSITTLLVKFAGKRLPASELVMARSVVGVAMGYWMLRAVRVSPWGNRKRLLMFRGIAGFVALLCFFWSLARLPLAEATVLFYMSPAFSAVLAAAALRERLSPWEITGTAVSLIGVAFVAQPEFLFGGVAHGHSLAAIAVGLLGAVMGGCAYVTVRKLRETEHHLTVVFYFPLVSVIACAPVLASEVLVPTPTEWLLLIGIGVLTQFAQIYLTKGLSLEKTAKAMSASYLQIVFAALWGFTFLAEIPNVLCILGAIMIIAGTIMTTSGS